MGPHPCPSILLVGVPQPFYSPYLLALALGTVTVVVLAMLTRRRLNEPGAREFLLLLCCLALWQAVTAIGLATADEGRRLFWEKVNWLFPAVVVVLWVAFALAYTGSQRLTRRRALALFAPLLLAQVVLWVAPQPLAWASAEPITAGGVYLIDQQSGPLSWLVFAYMATLILFGSGLLLRFGLTARHLYWDQAASLCLGAAAPLVVGLLSIVDATPLPGLNVTPYAFVVSALAYGNAMFRYDFLDHVPATRTVADDVVTDCIRDGVVVVDDEDRIVRANPVAERAIGRSEQALLGERLWSALPSAGLEDEGIAARAIYRSPTDGQVYELDDTPVTDHHDRTTGHVVLFRDVTGRENREQRLAVLNRTLRHNLRNEINVVEGYANQLASQLEGQPSEMADTIASVSRDLASLSTKARDAEAVMAGRSERPDPADLQALLDTVVDAATSDRSATVETTITEGILVPGTETVQAVLFNAVENAVVHTEATDPQVTITVERPTDDRVAVAVADDGPGVPETELSVLEEGVETPLEHGSGLGLWIISWGARSLGGEATFDTGPDGTTVTVTLPATDAETAVDPDESPLRVAYTGPEQRPDPNRS